MDKLTCCSSPVWGPDYVDMGREDACDLLLGRCINCGAYWLNVFQDSSGITGYEPVSADDAHKMLALPSGPELKAFMKNWTREHM
jgi:hypothetical protein